MTPESPAAATTPTEPIALDVAIVGAGPAGGAAALEFAGRGLHVAVIEQAVPPRYKTCGGGVLARALRRVPLDFRSVIERECHVAELVHHQPNLRFTCQRDYAIVSMVMRDRFDALLVDTARQKAGDVQLHAGTAVRQVTLEPAGVRLVTTRGTFIARFVIAADGANSTVARQLALPALQDVVPAVEWESTFPAEVFARHTTARFDFGFVPAGYGWVFPKGNHLSIGVGSTRRSGPNLPETCRRYAAALGLDEPLTESRHGYVIPCRPRARLFATPRVLLTGDAAGLADPVTAEGISAGIISGQLAARAILDGAFDDAAVRRRYRDTLHAELLADLRVARWLGWLLYERPRWFAFLLSRHGTGLSELMVRVVTGETTYRDAVRHPGHYLRLLRPRRR
ncbi:geranylgeranyl reductase family protein [Opitutus sp. ER46]|uniref:geranylgeranyl reductase family protein n=1 Tax=Opitutus sp. ER46 TaxID=2161864 RepID=UPI000D2F6AD0|nr:geranylgeranyl reductase family protein [Opitutus sp. ER46]PTX95570.1 hypothetical protein DB354_09115 [Opitutus sp. ER46]